MKILLAVALAATTLLASCQATPKTATVKVDLRITACTDAGRTCFNLGVPEAEVALVAGPDSRLATGVTDATGRVTLATTHLGTARLVAVSRLIQGGQAEISVMLTSGVLDQSLWAPMSTDVESSAP